MPDQRGFAGSDRPREVDAYKSDVLVDDMFALADALGSIDSRSSGTTGAERSRGARRCAATRA